MPDSLLVIHAAATWFMLGLSSTVQWVHYPLFAEVGGRWEAFHEGHTRRILAVLAVPWTVEGLTALALPFVLTGSDRAIAIAGLVLLAAIAALTAFGAVPAHGRLADRWDPQTHASLLRLDRIRWLLWVGRALVATALLL